MRTTTLTKPEEATVLRDHYLREWRLKRGLTQADVGRLIGAHKGIISRYETGDREPSIAVMRKLCEALDIVMGQFFAPPDWPSIDGQLKGESRDEIIRLSGVVDGHRKRER